MQIGLSNARFIQIFISACVWLWGSLQFCASKWGYLNQHLFWGSFNRHQSVTGTTLNSDPNADHKINRWIWSPMLVNPKLGLPESSELCPFPDLQPVCKVLSMHLWSARFSNTKSAGLLGVTRSSKTSYTDENNISSDAAICIQIMCCSSLVIAPKVAAIQKEQLNKRRAPCGILNQPSMYLPVTKHWRKNDSGQ